MPSFNTFSPEGEVWIEKKWTSQALTNSLISMPSGQGWTNYWGIISWEEEVNNKSEVVVHVLKSSDGSVLARVSSGDNLGLLLSVRDVNIKLRITLRYVTSPPLVRNLLLTTYDDW